MALPSATHEQVVETLRQFDSTKRSTIEWTGWEDRPQYKWAIEFEGRLYPVKQVIADATGTPTANFSGGSESNDFLRRLEFDIVPLHGGSISAKFEEVMDRYAKAKGEQFGNAHPLNAVLQSLRSAVADLPQVKARQTIRIQISAGQGNWATIPWLALLDQRETDSTQRGVYVVYLFRADMSGVYLTLNQGVTELVRSTGPASARRQLREQASKVRVGLDQLESAGFLRDNDINLATDNDLGRNYEAGSIAYKFYAAGEVPQDEQIAADLEALLVAYSNYLEGSETIVLNDVEFERMRAAFQARYSDFTSFKSQQGRYYEEERNYKSDLAETFARLIRREDFVGESRDIGRAFGALEGLLKKPLPRSRQVQNLVGWQSLTFMLGMPEDAKSRFVEAVGGLLFGEGEVDTRLDRFSGTVDPLVKALNPKAGSSPVRGIGTLLAMLANPGAEVFLRSEVTNEVATRLIGRKILQGPLTGSQYLEARSLYQAISVRLAKLGWEPIDLFDAQGFAWASLREPRTVESPMPGANDLVAAHESFAAAVRSSGLVYDKDGLVVRSFLASIATKRFVILTGLSGSGKTQLALRFGEWLGQGKRLVVAVRPDWTGSEFLFGYEDALLPQVGGRRAWHVPASLRFILDAHGDPANPYVLILDEMNLAHVERYFADVLSGMESGASCLPRLVLGADGAWRQANSEPTSIPFPPNLVVIGTVNVDETTYMFSPKVLDRANTFEFRVGTDELLQHARKPHPAAAGAAEVVSTFATIAMDESYHIERESPELAEFAVAFREVHRLLSKSGFEFGHRVFYEGIRFAAMLAATGESNPEVALDLQILQKVLPRLHGGRRRLEPVLLDLARFCHGGGTAGTAENTDPLALTPATAHLPRSFDKLCRMLESVRANQFAGFTS